MKPTRAGACRVKDRDIKRGNRAATVKNQMMWTDFNTMPCAENAVQHSSVNLRSKNPLQEETLANSLLRKCQA